MILLSLRNKHITRSITVQVICHLFHLRNYMLIYDCICDLPITAAAINLVAESGAVQEGNNGYSRYCAQVNAITAFAAGNITQRDIQR